MRIIKHSSQNFPTVSTGALVGMDINGTLEVTNSFPFPHAADTSASDNNSYNNDGQNLAAAAPRSKANHAYQNEMLKFLREVNVDAQNVGWYLSTNMGNFVNLNTIENQFFYQKEPNERTVTLVYDVSRSSQGSLSLKAYRLSPQFIAAYKESKFTTERYDCFLSCSCRFCACRMCLGRTLTFLHLACKRAASATRTSSPSCP